MKIGKDSEASSTREDTRRTRGKAGEEIARRYLKDHDYSILASNFSSRYGEIDIIVRRGGIVAFVEVKARRDKQFGEPFEAVSPRKQNQIRRMAEMWLAANEGDAALEDCDFRFDVVSIMLDENDTATQLLHIEDAFR
ncbi:MAG: YraN family protein [Thermoleophilia bacterium]